MEKKIYEAVLKNSIETFKGTYKTGVSLFLTQVGVLILFIFLSVGLFIWGSTLVATPTAATFSANPLAFTNFFVLLVVGFVFLVTGMTLIGSFFNAALSYAANCDSYKDALKKSVSKFWGILGLSFLVLCIILPAYILFIIPGVFLSIALVPVLMIYLYEDVSITKAISRAFLLTRGKRLDIFILLLLVLGVSIGLSMVGGILSAIPFLGIIIKFSIDVVFSYFAVIVYRELYWNLKETEVLDEQYEEKYLKISHAFIALSVLLFIGLTFLLSFLITKGMSNPEAVSHFLSNFAHEINKVQDIK